MRLHSSDEQSGDNGGAALLGDGVPEMTSCAPGVAMAATTLKWSALSVRDEFERLRASQLDYSSGVRRDVNHAIDCIQVCWRRGVVVSGVRQ